MNELNKKRNRKIEGPEKLVIMMMVVAAAVGLLIEEYEIKLICAILFVIGGFILFMSISGKAKGIIKEEEILSNTPVNNKTQNDMAASKNNVQNYAQKKLVFDDSGSVSSIEDEKEYFVVKSTGNENHSISTNGYAKANKYPAKNRNSKFFEIDFLKLSEGRDPKTEFNLLLKSVLRIIKEATFANTVAFFWVNLDKKTMIFDICISNSDRISFKGRTTLPLGVNLVSNVALSGKARIVSNFNIDSEKDLLGYYDSDEYIRSVVGIPVQYNDMVVGVLIIDSKEEDTYGEETLTLLSSFIDLISNLIKNSTEKYDYYVDSLVLNKIEILNQSLKDSFYLKNLSEYSLKVISEFLEWDFMSFSVFDPSCGEYRVGMVIKKNEGDGYVETNSLVDSMNSIIGNMIRENKFALIEDLSQIQSPRFNKNENIINSGSFLAMPIYLNARMFAVISIESRNLNTYTIDDAGILNKFCSAITNLVEITSLKEYIKDKISIDEITNIPNKRYFLENLGMITDWIRDYNDYGVLIFLSIDKFDELSNRYGEAGINTILVSVTQVLNSNKESYHLIGRLSQNIFGLFLLRYTLDEGKVFSEKVRKSIASNVINFQNKSFSVTASLGLIEVKRYQIVSEITDNAYKVLGLAQEEGGNRVKLL